MKNIKKTGYALKKLTLLKADCYYVTEHFKIGGTVHTHQYIILSGLSCDILHKQLFEIIIKQRNKH